MNDHHHPRTSLSGYSHPLSIRHGRYEDYPDGGETPVREIHALQPPPRFSNREPWEVSSHVSSSNSLSMASDNFTTLSREFSALVVAGSAIENDMADGEEHHRAETRSHSSMLLGMIREGSDEEDISSGLPPLASAPVRRVEEEEVESKIRAWETFKVAKINNQFKREGAVIGGWENAQVERASASMRKVERKLEEKRARALEKMQNDIAKARWKAEEKRASAEGRRGTKVAKVFEICNSMRALGRYPSRSSLF